MARKTTTSTQISATPSLFGSIAPKPASTGRTWTPQQLEAIQTIDCSLLVSAAAGSGKTAVLSERCSYLVCDAPEPCDVDELLVVTFTEAAAAEMKSRIQSALRERVTDTEDRRLLRQLALAEHAQVSTLHGFCSRVLRQHFHLLGLDPGFSIIDGDEATLLRAEIARELFDDRYESDTGGAFQPFVDVYGNGNDEGLMAQVISTHDLLCSVVDPEAWKARARRRIAEAASGDLKNSELGEELYELIGQKLAAMRAQCEESVRAIKSMPEFTKQAAYLAEIGQTLRYWDETFAQHGLDALAEIVKDADFPNLPPSKNDIPGKDLVVARINAVRNEMKPKGALYELLRFSTKDWQDGLRAVQPHAEVFLDLVDEFSRRYTDAKRASGSVDFSDLERLALNALRDETVSDLAPSNVARAYQRQFKHVLVDEYQDINEVQNAILHLVSRESYVEGNTTGNLFSVGDVKQSIYRFRLAEPNLFLNRERTFREGRDCKGKVIDLQANFRSRGPLLDVLNDVFRCLITRQSSDIEYDRSHELVAAAPYPAGMNGECFTGAPIELHLLSKEHDAADNENSAADDDDIDLDQTEREAMFIVKRIGELMGAGGGSHVHVMEKSPDGALESRPLRYGDIVILLRSLKYKGNQFVDILRRSGIPVHSESGSGFFQAMEVLDMLALLNVLDNQQQDIHLTAVLRSPFGRLAAPEDSLARVRLAYSDHVPFHQAIVQYANDQRDELAARLNEFLDDLEKWREMARHRALAELIWTIYDETGYLAFCSGLDDGEQRTANLIDLHERATQFGTFNRQGLRRFLQFIDKLQEESDLGQPSIVTEADNVVRVMSIHKSKGLEFPVVFLPDLGKAINLQDSSGNILIDRKAGIGLTVADEEKQVRYPSLASTLVSARIKQQSMAEELRVLYVAMTRAREHLILVGSCKEEKLEKWKSDWSNHAGAFPADYVQSAKSMLDWIGPVAAALKGAGKNGFDVTWHASHEINQWPQLAAQRHELTPQQRQLAELKPLPNAKTDDPIAAAVISRLTFKYPSQELSTVAAAGSVTSLAKHGQAFPVGYELERAGADDHDDAPNDELHRLLASPRFLADEPATTAAERGTATHLLLQHLHFDRCADESEIKAQLDDLVSRRLMTEAQARSVDLASIMWLVQSELGTILRADVHSIRRELPIYFSSQPIYNGQPVPAHDALDNVMLRGRIDALIDQPDGLIVVDYKTDRVAPGMIEQRRTYYEPQVTMYRNAIEKITHRNVKSVYLAFLTARQLIVM